MVFRIILVTKNVEVKLQSRSRDPPPHALYITNHALTTPPLRSQPCSTLVPGDVVLTEAKRFELGPEAFIRQRYRCDAGPCPGIKGLTLTHTCACTHNLRIHVNAQVLLSIWSCILYDGVHVDPRRDDVKAADALPDMIVMFSADAARARPVLSTLRYRQVAV